MDGQLRGLLVDYGGVLTNPLPEFMDGWVKADGIDADRFAGLMRRWLGPGAARNPVHDLGDRPNRRRRVRAAARRRADRPLAGRPASGS